MSDPLTAILELGQSVIDRLWADPVKQAEEARKLQELYQKGDQAELDAHVKLMIAQLNVNAKEAESKSLFIAGWRPAIGWVGASAMAYQFVLYPFLTWVWATLQAFDIVPQSLTPPPVLDTGALFSIVTAMLGIGAMRSHDKRKGVSTEKIK